MSTIFLAAMARPPRSTMLSPGVLYPKIGSKGSVNHCGVALAGQVCLTPHGLYPPGRYMIGNTFELLRRILCVLVPGSPPVQELLQLWPSLGQCHNKIRAQSCHRGGLVALLSPCKRKHMNSLVDSCNLFSPYGTLLTIIRYAWVDV